MIGFLPVPRRPGLLLLSLVAAGFISLSIHVGMLAAGAPFPLPRPPLWAQWLSEAIIAAALLAVLVLAERGFGHRTVLTRTLVAFVILASTQETLRAGIMTAVVTGGWTYSAFTVLQPIVEAFLLALLCVLGCRMVRSAISLVATALAIGGFSTAIAQFLGHAFEPLNRYFSAFAREDLYGFPYPFHVTALAYATFAEAVVGASILTLVTWNGLPDRKASRLLALAVLTASVKGVVGYTLLYSPFTGKSLAMGGLAWSQFLLEFLALGALVGFAWEVFGRSQRSCAITGAG